MDPSLDKATEPQNSCPLKPEILRHRIIIHSVVNGGRGGGPTQGRAANDLVAWQFGVFNLLYGNAEPLARTLRKEDLLDEFETNVNAYIAQASRRRFFVHAGVVGWKGQAIVVPGRSYSGKSTLVKEFLNYGATYYSEFAVFDRRGYVYLFAKRLAHSETKQGRSGRTRRNQRVQALARRAVALCLLSPFSTLAPEGNVARKTSTRVARECDIRSRTT